MGGWGRKEGGGACKGLGTIFGVEGDGIRGMQGQPNTPSPSHPHTSHPHPLILTQDSTQQTMLMAWLVELFLNDLGTLKDEEDTVGHRTMQQDFHKFLESQALRVCK